MRALLTAASAAVLLGLVLPATAGPLGDEVVDACRAQHLPSDAPCEALRGVLGGLERPGISVGDFRNDPVVQLSVANFYFSPKVSVMHDRQLVVWTNDNPPGGNRHSVASSDWGCDPARVLSGCTPVLPVPGAAFGGGRAFKSPGPLQPGDSFALYVDTASMDPDAYVKVTDGTYLVAYHCYIHGAAQMQGLLLVTDVQGP